MNLINRSAKNFPISNEELPKLVKRKAIASIMYKISDAKTKPKNARTIRKKININFLLIKFRSKELNITVMKAAVELI